VLDILAEDRILERNRQTANCLNQRAEYLHAHPRVERFRNTGMIWAFEVRDAQPGFSQDFQRRALGSGVLLRPLGNTVYWMPPYVIGEAEVDFLVATLSGLLDTTPG
jgi:adenosylmethionine-8-amino-7-oxononanoate aminotransferase